MRQPKFSMNAFLLIVILASALYLFVSTSIYDMARPFSQNDVYEIEGTEYVVKYRMQRTTDESGIYEGPESWSKLLVPGSFGYDWGAAAVGDFLYCNEYHKTKLGFMTSDLVKIDLNTLEKTVLYTDTMMIGRCASGELVCMGEMVPANWLPKTNELYRLYAASKPKMRTESDGAMVRFYDPEKDTLALELWDDAALTDAREEYYLSAELSEVRP